MVNTNKKILKIVFSMALVLFAFSVTCGQQPSKAGSSASLEKDRENYAAGTGFLKRLKLAIRKGQKEKIASWVLLPLELNAKPSVKIKTKKDFVKYYDRIFTKKVRDSVLKQDEKKLFFSSNGFMAGGVLWFAEFDKMNFRIFMITTCKPPDYTITSE